jgi:hypothetical protein
MRIQELHFATSGRTSHTRQCNTRGCHNTTREGKPYCPDHVEDHPYVQEILQTLQASENELTNVRRRGKRAINAGGLVVKEITLHLSLHGGRTLERLSRELNVGIPVLKSYVDYLVAEGVAVLGRTTRGSTIVRLVNE